MKRMYWMPVVIVVVMILVGYFCIADGQVQGRVSAGIRLPGARTVISAARYPSIQAAIDALPAEGGVVRIPPGTFEISEPLKVSVGDVLIEGSGTATHIKNVNTEGQSALILQHASAGDNRQAELWRIQLADFRITGNEKSGHGIDARRINEVFIDGVTVSYHGGDGIRLYFCYEDPRICNSLITRRTIPCLARLAGTTSMAMGFCSIPAQTRAILKRAMACRVPLPRCV